MQIVLPESSFYEIGWSSSGSCFQLGLFQFGLGVGYYYNCYYDRKEKSVLPFIEVGYKFRFFSRYSIGLYYKVGIGIVSALFPGAVVLGMEF